jgi:hypothetical protein
VLTIAPLGREEELPVLPARELGTLPRALLSGCTALGAKSLGCELPLAKAPPTVLAPVSVPEMAPVVCELAVGDPDWDGSITPSAEQLSQVPNKIPAAKVAPVG